MARGWCTPTPTAGVVLALLMVHFAYQGEVRTVLWLFLAAMVVDGTDGMLARRWRVKELRPVVRRRAARQHRRLHHLRVRADGAAVGHRLPAGDPWGGVVAGLPLVASCYQFCRTDAKTDDHFFLGFPSYWNIVAFYVVVLRARRGRDDRCSCSR